MPASERRFSENPPSDLYLDTDLIVAFLIETEPHHQRCRAYLANLEVFGQTTIYLSTLSWVEYIHVVSRERFRQMLPEELQRQLRIDRWKEPLIRQAYAQAFVQRLEAVLRQFTWIELDLTSEIRRRAIDYMAQYNLGNYSATPPGERRMRPSQAWPCLSQATAAGQGEQLPTSVARTPSTSRVRCKQVFQTSRLLMRSFDA